MATTFVFPTVVTPDSEGDNEKFLLLLVEKGLQKNKKYFPEDFETKSRGNCFAIEYSIHLDVLCSYAIYAKNENDMPAKFIRAAYKKAQVLRATDTLVETGSVSSRELGIFRGGVKFSQTIFALSGLEPKVDEACSIVECMRTNFIRDIEWAKSFIMTCWKNEIACELLAEMYQEMPW